MSLLFRIVVAICAIGLAYAALNWPYFKVQLQHILSPQNTPVSSSEGQNLPPDTIWIRHLGIEAPLIYIQEDSEEAFQVALQRGVTHFTGTPLPGENGNAYFFGHSSDFVTSPGDYKTIFALLPRIQPGEIIEITNPSGNLFKYEVEKTFVVEPTDLSVLEQDLSKKQLTLQTSYPLGSALRRFIVVAQLIE